MWDGQCRYSSFIIHHSSFILMPSILFVAGDLSGDGNSARLLLEVRRRNPDWSFSALGGPHLKATGARMIGDSSRCGVIGIAPALMLLPRLLRLRRRTLQFLQHQKIDAVVLCDWGAFNGRLLSHLQAAKVPILYYFPPGSWRKSGQGGSGIAPFVSRVATPFEWSAKRLREAGAQAEWVGHPILETVQPLADDAPERLQLRRELGVPHGAKLVALLPGSRALELKYIAPHLAAAAPMLRASSAQGELHFIAAIPRGAGEKIKKYFPSWMEIVEERAADVLMACDAAIVKSGTATLEAAVADAPQVVVYDGPALMRAQWKLTGARHVPFVAMPNIILEREAVPELLGEKCRAAPIAIALTKMLRDNALRAQVRADYALVRRALGEELPLGATQRTAQILDEMLCAAT